MDGDSDHSPFVKNDFRTIIRLVSYFLKKSVLLFETTCSKKTYNIAVLIYIKASEIS
jgi:hypothetical protein